MLCRSLLLPRTLSSIFAAALVVVASMPSATSQEVLANHLKKRVVADYVYWSKDGTPPYAAAQIPYHKLTHINHAGVSFDSTGTLSMPQGFIEPELNNRAHAAGVKVMLLIGGDFPGLEASGAMPTLINNIAAFEKQYGYDGVDMDWEYPETQADRIFLVKLMAGLRLSN